MHWYLLDRVTELVPGSHAVGHKAVTLAEQLLHDHFPDHPLYPGVLVIEAAAQLGGLLVERSQEGPSRALLVQVDRTRFHAPIRPGDRFELRAELKSVLSAAARVGFLAQVRGDRVAQGELTFRLVEGATDRLHRDRERLYATWLEGTPSG